MNACLLPVRAAVIRMLQWCWVSLGVLYPRFWRADKDTYLFLPINGAGLGHLTRSLAIARRIKDQQPNAKIVFMTTSIGVMLVHRAGFICHHITPHALLDVGGVRWNLLFFKTLKMIVDLHRPRVLIFDGTVPYLGLRKLMRGFGSTRYVWVKRGLYKDNVNTNQLRRNVKLFDKVISPGELVESDSAPAAEKDIYYVAPISLLDHNDLLSRDLARDVLRVPRAGLCAYIQLGAGNINGVVDLQKSLIACLKKRNIRVVLGQSPIALNTQHDTDSDSVIVDYPNSQYFRAFDFAVLAGGYNSVCESVMLGLPTLFIPNTATGADDQLRRAKMSEQFGPFKVLESTDELSLNNAIDSLVANPVICSYRGHNGAQDAARMILKF